MRKWEDKYEKLKNGELESKLAELQEKVDNKSITKEEYTEYKKYLAIKENMSKIENILEYRDVLSKQIQEINAEIKRRETIVKLDKDRIKLELDLSNLMDEKQKLESQLRDSNLKEDKKQELKDKLSEVMDKMNQNQTDFAKNQSELSTNAKPQVSKIGKLEDHELKAKKTSISTKISKCNMIGNNLIQGRSWDSIDMQLEKWADKKFTSKKEAADKMREANEVDKQEEKESKRVETAEVDKQEDGQEHDEENRSDLPVEVSEFDKKHPKIAAIKNWFRQKWSQIRGEEQEDEKAESGEQEENSKTSSTQKEADDFRKYIRDVAEKGLKNVKKEELENAKQAAREREAQKFGGRYANNDDFDKEEK